MKYIYTATFVPNEDGTKCYCRVPDLPGCITTGSSIDDAIEMITDAASGWLVVAEDEGTKSRLLPPSINWIFRKMPPAPSPALIHSHTGRQLTPGQSVKMSHFLHGWPPWQKSVG